MAAILTLIARYPFNTALVFDPKLGLNICVRFGSLRQAFTAIGQHWHGLDVVEPLGLGPCKLVSSCTGTKLCLAKV
jgi:hypothetical protein